MNNKSNRKMIFFHLIIISLVLLSCQEDQTDVNNRPLLKERFNGKYEIISSTSKIAVDLNDDGVESTNLFEENPMILLSKIRIRIPREDELFLYDNEFVLSESWPTENEHRLADKENIIVYDLTGYDIYGNILIGEFNDSLSSATFRLDLNDDGKNTLVEIKSFDVLEDETVKLIVIRKLYTRNGWTTTEIESFYKRYTVIS
ncbi:hypothetical protein ACT3CD_10400 [Geofilum sp. OHC36d9]|uniref:hypothetical protein n=1 Tax=Geofilum sp. OHC36d9 TaxID=3458413 RepID=UPI0040349F7F